MKTHRQMYPEQYTHPLVGKLVRFRRDNGFTFTVARVVISRFGTLAIVQGDEKTAYSVENLEVVV